MPQEKLNNTKPHQVAVDVISNLNSQIDTLPTRERKVAGYVQNNLESISSMTIAELARVCDVSTPTVVRFCRSVGCEGFREFKIRLAQNLAVSLQYLVVDSHETQRSDAGNIDQIIGALSATVNIMRKQVDHAALSQAADLLGQARSVVIGGVGGGASMLAEEAANRLFRLGIPTIAVSDSYLLQMRAATLHASDVLLLISASGEANEMLSAAEIANGYGASTLAITRSGSRLSEVAQTAIALDLPEDPDVHKPTASRYAYLVIIDALAMSVAQSQSSQTTENLRRIRASLTAFHGRTGPQPLGD
ncbi:MurR/RpiR family transcriptional regulator [Phaeobacter gallaeciensis]|uniref:Transcriptional regulator, RpiR family n=1 Tax=Phaeobacter gallaeciensis TaxID=60890 RepID=A0AAC9ZDH0_9RHOB|nr:MurR/RpiR family transcriptional regulator [Phaeobacter gallaeciensis]AHD11847.1 transcriptional regulator, RpiR family [Phaeobacter gallaeciensis DSM 26640]ATE95110.1 transcriptional regulator, RpiR family [Phaeobacter gallaeciensis]ATE99418.1 transcriptional regulator, RpiR family [Phaeobacter gallaeciensis]ATF03815.1 transcriptional regulator, RpiR family [Phaeobacter gallaeciensis]ATF08008.1 transcriptional regulator, RpiR family [Phaeobacter gallaeciensis]